jgi:ABC-type nitrate/sulfonate/bicarbonate transport system permease component
MSQSTQTQLITIQVEQQRQKLRSERVGTVLRALGRSVLNTVITIVIVIGLWQLIVSFGGISPYVAKGPMDVWQFLFVDEPDVRPDDTASIHRVFLAGLLVTTLQDAALGFPQLLARTAKNALHQIRLHDSFLRSY